MAAIIPVIRNTVIVEPKIFPSLFILDIFPTALAIEQNTIGTTIINIILRKISPRGFKIMAFSLKNIPMKLPSTIPKISTIGESQDSLNFFNVFSLIIILLFLLSIFQFLS